MIARAPGAVQSASAAILVSSAAKVHAMEFVDFLGLIGFLLRILGALVFGLGAGWLAVRMTQAERTPHQLSIAVFLGLVGGFALVGHWVQGGGTLGAFGIGVGGALLFWGMMASRTDGEAKPSAKEK